MGSKDKQRKVKIQSPPPAASSSESASSSSEEEQSSSGEEEAAPTPAPAAVVRANIAARNTKYTPPSGFKPVRTSTSSHPSFDYDTFSSNSNLELWAIRLPEGVKPSALDGVKIQLPSSNDRFVSTLPIHKFTKHSTEYEIHPVRTVDPDEVEDEDEDEVDSATKMIGHEMKHLVPLLPRASKNGKLYQAPRPITRSFYITRSLPSSTSSLASTTSSSLIASQPSPVPGALLSDTQLLLPSTSEEIQKIRQKRPQPAGVELRYKPILSGTRGIQGGLGNYKNEGVVLPSARFGEDYEMTFVEGEERVDRDEGTEVKQGEMVDIVSKEVQQIKKTKGSKKRKSLEGDDEEGQEKREKKKEKKRRKSEGV